jgi:hypothetical protein
MMLDAISGADSLSDAEWQNEFTRNTGKWGAREVAISGEKSEGRSFVSLLEGVSYLKEKNVQPQNSVINNPSTTPIISGYTANYTDPHSGAAYTNAWIQIRQINYVPYGSAFVVTDIYLNLASYQAGKDPVCANVLSPVYYNSSGWNTYFDPAVMDIEGNDIQMMAVTWLQTQIPPSPSR